MAQQRKQFNYLTATAEEIAQHFKVSSSQAVYAARKTHEGNELMTIKLNAAFYLHKLQEVKSKHEREYISYVCWFNEELCGISATTLEDALSS